MKITDAKIEIVKRCDEDFESVEYLQRAEMLLKATISSIISNPEYAFTEQDYKGLVVVKLIKSGDVLFPSTETDTPSWDNGVEIYALINAYHFNNDPLLRKRISILPTLTEFNLFINSTFFIYENRVALVQVSNKIFSSRAIDETDGFYLTYVRPMTFDDEVYSTPSEDRELEESFSLSFLDVAISIASEKLKNEIKGKDA